MLNIQRLLFTTAATMGLVFAGMTAVAGTKVENGVEVRDWSAIDLNKDHSISPEEMEKFLKEQWAKKNNK